MKKFIILTLSILTIFACKPQEPSTPQTPPQELPDKPDNPNKPDQPDQPDQPDKPDQPDQPSQPSIEVVDPGATPEEFVPTPQYPNAEHEVSYTDFYNPLQDELDEFGNTDYVISQGNGTSWPMITDEGFIRLYQGTSAKKGGSYIRVRTHNGASLLEVEVGSATKTKLAYSINGKAAKSKVVEIPAGGKFTVSEGHLDQVCFYCMGTSQNERWELNYIRVKYVGGFVEEDYYQEPKEYGPLVRATLPFEESFESGFPTTDKPSYYKYGITAGRDNLQWSTWYGSFSWQNPIEGEQSAQLRIYQEEEDYYKEQFGHLKMEYFLEGISEVDFKYYMSEYWIKATISYCEFGENEWKNPKQIALESYSDRQKVKDFKYTLDEGKSHNAKIKIELDPATGYPTQGHYDFIVDKFIFQ